MVEDAQAIAAARVARNPRDREAIFERAMATGYYAKLTRGAADAKSARKQFETLIAANPNDCEPLLALAGFSISRSVHSLGGFLAAALGAKKATGLAALDRAVKVGGNRPLVTGFAALLLSSPIPRTSRWRAMPERLPPAPPRHPRTGDPARRGPPVGPV